MSENATDSMEFHLAGLLTKNKLEWKSHHPMITLSMNQTIPIYPPCQGDIDVLYSIYNATHGDQWEFLYGQPWNFTETHPNPCNENWQGISCDERCTESACWQEIIHLDIEYMNLIGTLPLEIGNFSALRVLVMEDNFGLIGTIPETIGNISTLNTLAFSDLSISGTIPDSIGNLQNLTQLSFTYLFTLSSTIPETLFFLPNLTEWLFDGFYIHGSLSSSIGNLTKLQSLGLYGLYLTGTLPEELANIPSLQNVLIISNQFSGSIPSQLICQNKELIKLQLSNNYFTGSIPITSECVGEILENLQFDGNLLSGTIPPELYYFSNLNFLNLGHNTLSGTLSTSIGNLTQLQRFYINNNYLNGTLPTNFTSLYLINTLSMGYNYFTGSLPEELTHIPSMQMLIVSSCFFTGVIPAGFGSNENFDYLDVSYNLLEGSIPEDLYFGELLTGLLVFNNFLTGTVSHNIGHATAMAFLDMSNNLLYGTVPSEVANLHGLLNLGLGWNAFVGEFNVDLSQMLSLGTLQLEHCLFTGEVSLNAQQNPILQYINISTNYFIGNVTTLSYAYYAFVIDISSNLLSGSLPSIAKMSSITIFFAQSNLLEGSITHFFGKTVNSLLTNVDISDNLFTGPLPSQFLLGYKISLASFAAVQNCFTGTMPESFCNLTSLEVLALDGLSTAKSCRNPTLSDVLPQIHSYALNSQAIHGGIPKCLFAMPYLETLHLAGNRLTGSIPVEEESDLGRFLSDISLSHNELTGTLPPPLQGGNRWSRLDVSYNKIKGELKTDDSGNSNTEGFLPNAFIYLNINRFSGRIPGFYYDMTGGSGNDSSGGELDMLRGNLFACPEQSLKSDVPEADPYHLQYGCGSDNLNEALMAWVCLVFCTFVAIYLGLVWMRRQIKQTTMTGKAEVTDNDDANSTSQSNLGLSSESTHKSRCWKALEQSFVISELLQWERAMSQWYSPTKESLDTHSTDYNLREWKDGLVVLFVGDVVDEDLKDDIFWKQIYEAGLFMNKTRRFVLWLGIYIICVGCPIYGCLTYFCGSYDNEYAWTISAAYLSGVSASAVLLIFFFFLFLLSIVPLHKLTSGSDERRDKEEEVGLRLDDEKVQSPQQEEYKRDDDNSEIDKVKEAFSPLHRPDEDPLTESSQSTILSKLETGISPSTSNGTSDSSSFYSDCLPLTTSAIPTQQLSEEELMKRKKLDWRVILLMKTAVAVFNISIVLLVNGSYVYVYLQVQRWSAMMLSVALSVFKVFWSMVVQFAVVHYLQPLQHLSSKTGLDESNVHFMSSLMLFNTIVAPCLATLVASSDCFYYVFASPAEISASYTFEQCTRFDNVGCMLEAPTTRSIDFAPPFSYSFQCSSAMLVDYAYVFAYKYVLIGVLYPLLVVVVVLYGDSRTERKEESGRRKAVSETWVEVYLLPPLWRREDEENSDMNVVFSSGDYIIRLSMMIGCLLTYGSVLPYLSFLICFSILSNTVLTQIGWLRSIEYHAIFTFLRRETMTRYDNHDNTNNSDNSHSSNNEMKNDDCSEEKEVKGQKMKDKMKEKVVELGKQCSRLRHGMKEASGPLLILLPLFYACYLFDVAGDAAGAWMALYFTVIFWSACILTSLVVARSEISMYMRHVWKLLSSGWSKRQANEQVRKTTIVQTSTDVDKKTIVEMVEEKTVV